MYIYTLYITYRYSTIQHTLYTVHYTMYIYNVYYIYTVQHILYITQCTYRIVYRHDYIIVAIVMLHNVLQYSMYYVVHCTSYIVCRILYVVHCIQYTVRRTLYVVHCTFTLYTMRHKFYRVESIISKVYTVQCTARIVQYTLHGIRCT